MPLTQAFYNRLAGDDELTAMLATYEGEPAVFTIDPAPGDATLPYIVTAGAVSQAPWDTKTTRGRRIMRDVRCYAEADGSVAVIEAIAERVRELFHRHALVIDEFGVVVASAGGPDVADEDEVYGRIVSIQLTMVQTEE